MILDTWTAENLCDWSLFYRASIHTIRSLLLTTPWIIGLVIWTRQWSPVPMWPRDEELCHLKMRHTFVSHVPFTNVSKRSSLSTIWECSSRESQVFLPIGPWSLISPSISWRLLQSSTLAYLTPSSCTFSPINLLASQILNSICFHFFFVRKGCQIFVDKLMNWIELS